MNDFRVCFNGATAMKPWKSRRRVEWSPAVSRFNGATAMKPWKSETGRGSFMTVMSLQWGHGDEAVEESLPPEQFGAKDLGPGLREGRPAGASNRSRSREMKS